MANIPEKPSVELVSWINGRTKLNQINLTTGVNANLANIKTAVDGIIDVISEDCLPKSAGQDEALTGVLYSDVNDVSLVGMQGKAGLRAYKPNTSEQAGQMLLTSDGTVSGSYRLSAQTYNKTQSDAAGSAVYNTLRMGDTEGLTYKIGSDVKFKVNDSGVATVGADPVGDLDVVTKQYADKHACLVETTWSELKALRDGGKLVPGQWYCITDYQCTTAQADTSSAGHQFDIIVLALDESRLSEEARAIQHAGDTYFVNSNLNAWKIWYCLDNDSNRFAWAQIPIEEHLLYFNSQFFRAPQYDGVKGNYCWSSTDHNEDYIFTDTLNNPTTGSEWQFSEVGWDIIEEGVDVQYVPAVTVEGKGVIFRMIDEFGNDVPYDFKNILFTKSSGSSTYTNAYTFTSHGSSNTDNSLYYSSVGISQDNVVGAYVSSGQQQLNFNVFYGSNCSYNIIRDNCSKNTFGSTCEGNVIGFGSSGNTFATGCSSNVFGGRCFQNTLGMGSHYNSFGSGSGSNTLGTSCQHNSFDVGCTNNSLGNGCMDNAFENACKNNTFGNTSSRNVLGAGCSYITFGKSSTENSVGCGCSYITFGTSSAAINYCQNNTFDVGCSYLYVVSDDTSASSANRLQNVHVHHGVSGTSSAYKTIIIPDRNLQYETDVYQAADGALIYKTNNEPAPLFRYNGYFNFLLLGVKYVFVFDVTSADAAEDVAGSISDQIDVFCRVLFERNPEAHYVCYKYGATSFEPCYLYSTWSASEDLYSLYIDTANDTITVFEDGPIYTISDLLFAGEAFSVVRENLQTGERTHWAL